MWRYLPAGKRHLFTCYCRDGYRTSDHVLECQCRASLRLDLVGSVAHDLNNVLTPLQLAIDVLGVKFTDPADLQLIAASKASASHGSALVQRLLEFARGADGRRTRLEPAQTLAHLEPLLRQSLFGAIHLTVEIPSAPWSIQADATQFNQVLLNLGINARDAMPTGGEIQIVTRNVTVDSAFARQNPGAQPGPYLKVSVLDTGCGISPDIWEKIFDPFFTTKSPGKGTGLGLAMVASIIKSHGGFVQLESEVGRGTVFHVYFPAERGSAG